MKFGHARTAWMLVAYLIFFDGFFLNFIRQLITRGIRCNTPQCKARMHTYCYNVYKRNSTSCPTCNKSWKPLPVGEEAWKEGQDKGKRRVRQKDSEERSEDEEEEAEQEEVKAEPSQRRTQASQAKQNGKGKKRAVASDDEMDEDEDEEEAPPRTQKRKARR